MNPPTMLRTLGSHGLRALGSAGLRALRSGTCLPLFTAMLTAACAAATPSPRDAARHDASAEVLLEHADASAAVGDMTRAEQYYVSALEAGAPAKLIVQRLLVACVADRRYPVAAQYAEQYLRRHPGDGDIQLASASIHAALGDTARALALLEDVVRRQPRRAEAHYALASVLRDSGQNASAADQHDLEYLKLEPAGPLAEVARARLGQVARAELTEKAR